LNVGELSPGWHEYRVRTRPDDPTEEPTVVTGRVLAPDPSVGVAVVSDLDDTVIKTGLGEGVVALRRTLFGQAETREPIPGMAALYQAVQAGPRRSGPACFYYLSTGPWNLYDMLTEFLELRGFPVDRCSSPIGVHRSGTSRGPVGNTSGRACDDCSTSIRKPVSC
jgi:phosphatidate phosphatase APP1